MMKIRSVMNAATRWAVRNQPPRFQGKVVACLRGAGFTLIELMVLVGILGVILTIGIPSIYHMTKKEGMRKAVSDVWEVCNNARAQAIFRGSPVEAKRDHLAAPVHLERWIARNDRHRNELEEGFRDRLILFDEATSLRVAIWAYSAVERAGGFAWVQDKLVEPLGPRWGSLLERNA